MSKQAGQDRILIIDDNPSIHEDFRKVLSRQAASTAAVAALNDLESTLFGESAPAAADTEGPDYQLEFATQGEEGLRKLQDALASGRPYAMTFVDMRMPPGWDGVQTIRQLWKADPKLQVAICTAYSDYTPAQISAALGVRDALLFVRKPFDQYEIQQIARTLTEKWATERTREDLARAVETRMAELRHAATHDKLTGLPNRTLLLDRVNTALRRMEREQETRCAVLFIDCDRFKIVNDSLGHRAGDELLLQIAKRITDTVRSSDSVTREADPATAARLGGDEFAILLDFLKTDADAARVAERLIEALGTPYVVEGHEIQSGISVGITTSSMNYPNAEDMIRDADTAMYRAKKAGGGRFVMFDQKMHQSTMHRLKLEGDLRRAIDEDQIGVHYQPIVDMRNRELIGFEALARWDHPVRGVIPPTEFIPIAEESGLINSLGIKVLERACRQLAEWHRIAPKLRGLTMSVNVSRKQLLSPNLLAAVGRLLKETGIEPQLLKLEITETAVASELDTAASTLNEIQKLNVQLHLDDVGTGYSSLNFLQKFPLDGLKIDRSVIEGMSTRFDQTAVIRAITSLAHNLCIPLVAEGIENGDQLRILEMMGCDHAQGYYFSKPLTPGDATKFIQDQCSSATAA